MSGEFDLMKDLQSTKFELRPQIFVKLSFREFCDTKLPGLISQKQKCRLWVHAKPWSNFCDLHWELICCNKWHQGTSEIFMPLEIYVGTHFHTQHGTKTTPVFLPADGEASWCLLQSFCLLTIRQHSATRKHLFLYTQVIVQASS